MYKTPKLAIVGALLTILVLEQQVCGQVSRDQSTFTNSEKELIVKRVSELVKENYVFPKVAPDIAEHLLNNLQKGKYADAKTKGAFAKNINDFYIRVGDRTIECWTEAEVPGEKMPEVPVRILIDEDSFSSAEGFAYSLKHLGRAEVVGQTSGGGAHGGSSHSIPGGLEVYIPYSRSIHPVTKTDFEGVGVKPDIEVSSNHALLVAHYLTIRQLKKDSDRVSKAASVEYEKVQKKLTDEIRQHAELIEHISDQPTNSPNVRSLDSNK